MDKKAMGLSIGVVSALFMLVWGWLAAIGWGVKTVELFSHFYIGFKPTFFGGIIGAIWGFVLGAIFGYLLAWFYNLFSTSNK